jgi:NAD(P) transhydrogenase subunit alpha
VKKLRREIVVECLDGVGVMLGGHSRGVSPFHDRRVKAGGSVDPPDRASTRARSAAKVRALQAGECRVDFVSILSIFVLACFVGYYVVWSVTPALHTPLMAVTNAISSVIIVGALIAAAAAGVPGAKWLGLAGVVLASVNIFGGFAVTARMLAMYKKKEKKG